MDDTRLGALLRMVRIRRGMRQADVSARAGISPSAVARHERGEIERTTHVALRRHSTVLGLRIELSVRGPLNDAMLDEEHAAVGDYLKRWLESLGWVVVPEASFSEYGERGRIDLLCWFAPLQVLLVIEIKTDIVDAQDLLGSLDAKFRLAATIARKRGWQPRSVAVMLAVTETDRNVRRMARVGSLFSSFSTRGQAARAWLAHPADSARLLVYVRASLTGRPSWQSGRRRVARRKK